MTKKAQEVPVAQPVKIICPACRSEIASDGGKLFARSKTLADLEEAAEISAKVGGEIEKLETELTELREEKKKREAKPAPAREADPDDELR